MRPTHLMSTTLRAKQPRPFYYEILSSTLTSTIVITAESDDYHIIQFFCFVNHSFKCQAHQCTILLVGHCKDKINQVSLWVTIMSYNPHRLQETYFSTNRNIYTIY